MQLGVGQADAVAGRRAVVIGVGAAIDFHRAAVAKAVDGFAAPPRGPSSSSSGPSTSRFEPEDLARAAERDQLDLARVARLEAHRGAGGDVQPHAVGRARGRTPAQRLTSKKWQCDPTCIGRSPRLVTSMRRVGRRR